MPREREGYRETLEILREISSQFNSIIISSRGDFSPTRLYSVSSIIHDCPSLVKPFDEFACRRMMRFSQGHNRFTGRKRSARSQQTEDSK